MLVPVPSDFRPLCASILPKSRLRGVVVIILGLLSIVPLLGVGIFFLETPRLKQQAFADLNAIADLKVEAWLAERHGDAVVLGASPGLIEDAALAAAGQDSAARRRIAERLETLKRAYAYESFVVVDASAQQILAIGLHEAIAEAPVQKALQAAF